MLDKELMGAARIGCHPLSNAATCVLTPDQLTQFLARTKHEPVIVDFEGAVVGASGAPKPAAAPKAPKAPKAAQEPTEGRILATALAPALPRARPNPSSAPRGAMLTCQPQP